MDSARILLRGAVIAELSEVRPDMPWFEARFTPTDGFSEVEPLFRRERELSDSPVFDADAWQSVWEQIWSEGVALALADGSEVKRDFAVHVYDDGTARFRY
jgi:hypothetical protein